MYILFIHLIAIQLLKSTSKVSEMLNLSTNFRLRRDFPNSETIPINCNSFKLLKNRALHKQRELISVERSSNLH